MNRPRVLRLVRLLQFLQSGKGHNASSLAEVCGCSRRTVFRDLDVLREAGVPLLYDDQEQHYSLRSPHLLPPTSFSTDEALAVVLLGQELGRKGGLPFQSAAQSAAAKIESQLPARLREQLRDLSPRIHIQLDSTNPLAAAGPYYTQLLGAIGSRRAVRIQYDSLTEWSQIQTKLHPYRLLFSRRSWYVIGRSSLHRSVRTFNVGRVRALEILDERYAIPRGFSLQRYLRNAWHLIPEPGPDHRVVVIFDKQVAQNVAEVTWHRTQQVTPRPDGGIEFSATVSGLGEISWWILGYGDQAEVVAPIQLRQRLVAVVRRMAERYGQAAGASRAETAKAPPLVATQTTPLAAAIRPPKFRQTAGRSRRPAG